MSEDGSEATGEARGERLLAKLGEVIRGKERALEGIVTALVANGHVLLEDVPGVGKTTLAKALSGLLGCPFGRVQFTPDLLPADITGSAVYNPKEGSFSYRKGPIFTSILLADEINRASPRTQAALLEAMSERQVTIEGRATPLERPFLVLATQNPVDFHGTYPLPEAQLDRFLMRLELGYPGLDAELQMLTDQSRGHPLDAVEALFDPAEVVAMQQEAAEIEVSKSVARYIVTLVAATRKDSRLKLGVSPRGSLGLRAACRARAWLRGRNHVLPDDVKSLAVPVLAHRLVLETKARYQGLTREGVIEELLERTPVES